MRVFTRAQRDQAFVWQWLGGALGARFQDPIELHDGHAAGGEQQLAQEESHSHEVPHRSLLVYRPSCCFTIGEDPHRLFPSSYVVPDGELRRRKRPWAVVDGEFQP